ncbi:YtxH domain-containing protein [Flavobacterium sp. AS60]|uniref:YtxH domain-containing protein n=1 Tax=Flavobacterium anseongense TaxID=2910677 RepID=UPI001F429CBC|nr:YtxH domain-containing protein [Flavobacterium sp. AS60]MCF6129608.1 YtxH domain-containing protein [Flavobacterium sp. AS60]
MKNSNVILGVLGGVAVGAIAGILFAPAKGTKTRKRIMKKGNDYTKNLKNKFGKLYDEANAKYENIVKDAKEFATDHQGK